MTATKWEDIDWDDPAYAKVSCLADIHATTKIEPFCIIEDDVKIGEGTLIGPYNHIRSGSVIGSNSRIGGHGTLEGQCSVGNFVRIGTHCNIGWDCHVGDYVFIGGNFTGANDKRMLWQREEAGVFKPKGYKILGGARIGLGVVLQSGIMVGYEALIGAGSLVTKHVPDFEIWYGHPAKKRGVVPMNERLKERLVGA